MSWDKVCVSCFTIGGNIDIKLASKGAVVEAGTSSNFVIRFGVFELDVKNRELRRKGVLLDLPPQAFRVLTLLACRPNQLVTREEIQSELWPKEQFADLDGRLNFEIKRVREGLGDSAENSHYIETVRKSGYKFIGPVERMDNQAVASGSNPPAVGPFGNTIAHPPPAIEPQAGRPPVDESLLSRVSKSWPAVAGLLAVAAASLTALVWSAHSGKAPVIYSVSPILPQAAQTIVIEGRGFGTYTDFTALDTPFLAIRDQSFHWAAGRIVPENPDDVTLTVTRWTDSEIIVAGFGGDYGDATWELHPADKIEVTIWNPETGAGPATYTLDVTTATLGK
ncbi:MAG TPA: winged helix-turn-helix domain-containing protein [Terriglobia bacterium]|nr:winged helix-turn-helix domain-containing protein [Terriglobia bacterium]